MKIKKSILVTVSMLILSCQNIPNNITKNPISKSQNLSEKDDINIGVLSWKEVNECYSSSGCKPTYDKLLSSSEEVINVNCSCDNNAKLLKTRFTIDEPICDNQNTFTVTALTQEQKDNLKYLRDLFKIFREVDKINQYQYEITKTYNQAYYTEVITSTQNFSLYTYLSNQLRHKGQVNIEYMSKLNDLTTSLNKLEQTNIFSENIEIKNNIESRISDLKVRFANAPKIYEQNTLDNILANITSEYAPILDEYSNYKNVILSKIRLLSKEQDKETKLKDIKAYTLKIKSIFQNKFGNNKLNDSIYINYI